MSMSEWAKKEIELACAREKEDDDEDGMSEYGVLCYQSALKAFEVLLGDGHSGMSIGLTKNILNRLIGGKPLTAIEDTPDVWSDISEYNREKGVTKYQCNRMSALFKDVYDDGRVEYQNVDLYYCVDMDNNLTFHGGVAGRIVREMFPITMPYYPTAPIKVYQRDLLTDRKNGDFDTVGIFHIIKPDGERIEINRFFKETPDDWVEIEAVEYYIRADMARKLLESEVPNVSI